MTFLEFFLGIKAMSSERYTLGLKGHITKTVDADGRRLSGDDAAFFNKMPLEYHNLSYQGLVLVEGIVKKHLDAMEAELLGLGVKAAAKGA